MQTRKQLMLMGALLASIASASAQSVWTPQNCGTKETLSSVVWTGTRLVTAGFNGVIFTSSDGMTWSPPDSLGNIYYLAWTGTRLVGVGFLNITAVSSDGLTWTKGSTGVLKSMHDIICAMATFTPPPMRRPGPRSLPASPCPCSA
jgi:hypothetical protein